MSVSLEKSPTWLRIAQIVLGAITIALSAAVLANPDVTSLFFVTLLGISLILVGISKIIEGALVKQLSKGSRIISIIIGAISIGGGFFSLAHPIAALLTLVMVITIFILIHGAGLIGNGIASKHESKGSRIANIIIGGIVIAFSAILYAYPGLTLVLMVMYLSIGLLFNGIGSIISGISGHKRSMPRP
ncbi:MAG: DUF308 domain-containing protein [Nitrosopumilaceae archaeon]